ncbi:hypothetical protein DFQ28_006422 [Apophysomyces sp. BC1034]|nr:hypothetical protein DFQ30_000397 [Apophysomyces sp. BC1015]KAG0178133.1 hypothetical protein DFQ29_003888 [Apophysomyces sp. BC1021]KAG0187371.1 hypothetical protein DFQ28_006422 [Apophysomyces sp. BC1034]
MSDRTSLADESGSNYSTSTERTPLIREQDDNPSWSTEFYWLLNNSLPIIGTYLLEHSLQIASIFTLGHLGPTELAAATLATMFANVSAMSVAFGMTTALDTLCSQAWTGAKNKKLVGIHLQRALLILGLTYIPIAFVWWNAERILLVMKQDPALAMNAGLFLRILVFGAPAFIAFEAVKKFLQAQGIMKASTYVLLIASPLNFGMNYMMVYVKPFQLGFAGAPLATSISYWLMLLLLIAYIKFVDGKEAWGGWTRECLTDLWTFIRLAVPGAVMVCTEWWAFEISVLAASYLSTVDLAAQSIMFTLSTTTYTIPFGISVAASNRVGNSLGEGKAKKAKYASMMALCFAVAFGSLNSIFCLTTRSFLGYLFTSDMDVVIRVANVLPLCAIFQINDGLNAVCGGIVRGLGRQKIAAYINVIAYYVIALPFGLLLTFKARWELTGLWIGLTTALFLASAGELLFLLMVDWYYEAKRTLESIRREEVKNLQT